MSVILAFLATAAGKWIVGALAVVVAMLGAWMKGRLSGAKAERTAQKAKEADAYAKHLQDVEDAARARDAVPGSMSVDPYNRDRQG